MASGARGSGAGALCCCPPSPSPQCRAEYSRFDLLAGCATQFLSNACITAVTPVALLSAERRHMLATVRAIHATSGLRGFFRGLLPRTMYMGAGGVVYLGMYTVCCTQLSRVLPS